MPDEGHHERMVSVQGLRLFVREQGDGHPLLLINGLGADSGNWEYPEQILARRSRTIVFDSPGTGRSETPLLPAPCRHSPASSQACSTRWVTGGSTSSASPSEAPLPSSSRRTPRIVFGGSRSSRPSAAGEGQPANRRLSAVWQRTTTQSQTRSDTPTSCGPWPHGRACRGCDRSQPPRSSSPARTTCSSHPRTPCSSHVRSRMRACISFPGPSTSTYSAHRVRARGCWRSSSPPSRWNHPRRGRPGCPRPTTSGVLQPELAFLYACVI